MSEFMKLQEAVDAFVTERDWSIFHTPKNLAMCLSVEASELVELYQWQIWNDESGPPGGGPPPRDRIEEEVGDILVSLLNFCRATQIDPIDAASRKLEQIKAKYPANDVRGSAKKPDR